MQKSPFPVNVSSTFTTFNSKVEKVISFGLKAEQVKLEVLTCFHCLKEKFPEQHVDSWVVSFTAMCIFVDHSNSVIFDGTVSNIHA
jgi:hypothetical protein